MRDGERRVVVTGMGAVTPIGNDVAAFWDGLINGRSGIGPITLFDPSKVASRVAGEVKGFDADAVNNQPRYLVELQSDDRTPAEHVPYLRLELPIELRQLRPRVAFGPSFA